MITVFKENHVKIDKVRALRSQFSYTDIIMNMKLLAVVTPRYNYHKPMVFGVTQIRWMQ